MTGAIDNDMLRNFSAGGTGSTPATSVKTATFEFDQYEVVLALTEENRVICVLEVRTKKDFRSIEQKIGSTGYIDVEQYIK